MPSNYLSPRPQDVVYLIESKSDHSLKRVKPQKKKKPQLVSAISQEDLDILEQYKDNLEKAIQTGNIHVTKKLLENEGFLISIDFAWLGRMLGNLAMEVNVRNKAETFNILLNNPTLCGRLNHPDAVGPILYGIAIGIEHTESLNINLFDVINNKGCFSFIVPGKYVDGALFQAVFHKSPRLLGKILGSQQFSRQLSHDGIARALLHTNVHCNNLFATLLDEEILEIFINSPCIISASKHNPKIAQRIQDIYDIRQSNQRVFKTEF